MSSPVGVVLFPVTTFDETGDFDEDAFRSHILSTLPRAEFSCMIPLGSVGEFPYLSVSERKRIIEVAADETPSDVPIVPGTSALATRDAVELSKTAEAVGCDGILVTPASYFPPTADEVLAHYRALNDAVDIPIWAYNNPATTDIDISLELFSKLAEFEHVEYVKSGTADMSSFRDLVAHFGDELPVFAAPPNMFEKLAYGAVGWSGPIATIAPEQSIEIYEAFVDTDLERARTLFAEWRPLLNYFDRYPYVSTMKAILNLQNRDVGQPRDPIQPLGSERRVEIEQTMNAMDLL